LQKLSAEFAAMKKTNERNERRDLLASRPDFAPELVTVLKKAPLATVRDAVKSVPKAAPKKPAAALEVVPTRGQGQGDNKVRPSAQAQAMALRMGNVKTVPGIVPDEKDPRIVRYGVQVVKEGVK
jgi:hypothetical protein